MFKIVNYSRKYANFVIFLYKMMIFDQTLTQQTFSPENFNHFILFTVDYLCINIEN